MKATQDPVLSWQRDGKCTGLPSSIFFDDEDGSQHSRDAYKKVCSGCPVLSVCLETAIIYNFEGVWGGMTHKDRRNLYSKAYREELIKELKEIEEFVELPATAA